MVATIMVPGYCKRVAVTSIWQPLGQEIDAGTVELALGEVVTLGVSVCKTVMGTSSVVVISTVERMVEMIVEAGTCVVTTCVDPGCTKVLVVT